MKKILTVLMTVLAAGVFFCEVPEAYAIFGIRAARTVLAARKAKQALAEDPDAKATEKANAELQLLERKSETQPTAEGPRTT